MNDGPKGFGLRPGQTLCGDLDMRIDRDGTWYYQGSPIGRKALVRLFSRVLRRDEAGEYWLVTPAEVGRIDVEDAPFVAVSMAVAGTGQTQAIRLTTNVGDDVTVDAHHPIRVEEDARTGGPRPYVVMDGGVEALIARTVYYDLVTLGTRHGDGEAFGVWSAGTFFPLGPPGDAGGAP